MLKSTVSFRTHFSKSSRPWLHTILNKGRAGCKINWKCPGRRRSQCVISVGGNVPGRIILRWYSTSFVSRCYFFLLSSFKQNRTGKRFTCMWLDHIVTLAKMSKLTSGKKLTLVNVDKTKQCRPADNSIILK